MLESLICLYNVMFIEVFLKNDFSLFWIHTYWISFSNRRYVILIACRRSVNTFTTHITYPIWYSAVWKCHLYFLLQLKSRVAFHEHLLPVCLPQPNHELAPGTLCTVIGWGKREDKDGKYYYCCLTLNLVSLLQHLIQISPSWDDDDNFL